MKKRIHLKKRKKVKKINLFIITIMCVFICVYYSLNIINEHFMPILLEVAELEINKISTTVINNAVAKVVEEQINTDELFDMVMSDNGDIQTIDFNSNIVNRVLNITTNVVQNNLKLFENGNLDNLGIESMNFSKERINDLKNGIIAKIPIGVITNNSILSNLGPMIPIKLHFIGDVTSNITTRITQYGINNALIEIGVKLGITAQIMLPFVTEKMVLEFEIPLAIKMVQGKIPNYYGSGLVKDSSLYSIPLKDE